MGLFTESSLFLSWKCERSWANGNRLKKIMTVFFSGLFHFRLLSWVMKPTIIDGSWPLASMIKWFQLPAVKVVVHLIDLPSSFTITPKNRKLLNRFGSHCGFFKYPHSSLILIKWTSLITSFRTNSKFFFSYCCCDKVFFLFKIRSQFGNVQRVSRKMHTFRQCLSVIWCWCKHFEVLKSRL